MDKHVWPNTQNQAFSALLFLFRNVLSIPLESIDAQRAKEQRRLSVVLAQGEVNTILPLMAQTYRTMIELAWGSGLRTMEIMRLRVKDVALEKRSLMVRQGKGGKDRMTVLPEVSVRAVQACIRQCLAYHQPRG
ncbi:Tyrosine recombinase XerC [Sinobacterium norvegicum]|uniref:Tyrosine recombinase XerC n=1 Tax=Sinobacterium norvegicum TaxID=1641715 RepID=A0ABN8EF93_9GAMM|nr:Tyrosine recombinase XerC [Sinobacterium norvegicum]